MVVNKYLPADLYSRYVKTYADFDHVWEAVSEACALFHETASAVGQYFGYAYPQSDEDNMLGYLYQIHGSE